MAYTTIDKPTDYFETLTWTGNGSSPRTITGVGFNPDWVWGKRRDDGAGHNLFDTVRGAGSDKNLQSNGTGAEGSGLPATYGYISAFATDGFTVTAGSSDNAYWNNNTATYVAWNWLAGGTASSNSNGSITSSVSANTTAGFSIVSYTGTGSNATIGHGLGAVPRMIIVKRRDGSDSWLVQHGSLGAGKALNLDSTGAVQTYDPYWNGTEPTSSVFSIGNDGRTNGSSETYIAYCFAEKTGYSKFGSYTGNGNADGTFVYTGFKPAFVMIKNITSARNWIMLDNKRDIDNVVHNRIFPNSSSAQNTNHDIMDFLSNGFKVRTSSILEANESGSTFIYMCFAENPFVTSTGIPTTAR